MNQPPKLKPIDAPLDEPIYIKGRNIEDMDKEELIGVVRGLWFAAVTMRRVGPGDK